MYLLNDHHSIQNQEPKQPEVWGNTVIQAAAFYYFDTKFDEF
jgi:hypothetical protein